MATLLKNQALNVSVVGEKGVGNLRYYEGKLQVYQDGEWTTVIGDDKIPVKSISLVYTSTDCGPYGGDWNTSPLTNSPCNDGSPHYITATVLPENATDKSITWTSDNTSAAIDSYGVITFSGAKGETVTYTATANDGSGVSAAFQVFYWGSASCEPC